MFINASTTIRVLSFAMLLGASSCFSMEEGEESSERLTETSKLVSEMLASTALGRLQTALGYSSASRDHVFFRPNVQRAQDIVLELLQNNPSEELLNTILPYLAQVVERYDDDIGSIHWRELFIALAASVSLSETSIGFLVVLFIISIWVKHAALSPNHLTKGNLTLLRSLMVDIVQYMKINQMEPNRYALKVLNPEMVISNLLSSISNNAEDKGEKKE